MGRERRIAAIAAIGLLVTMFLPWYGLQSLNRKTGVIHSHNINAFGDVSFVEAAVFLVAAGVLALLLARAEGREFNMPGGDGTIIALAGAWAGVLIFYRVFDRPGGHGYPVGIQWGFFLAFVAAGSLAYAGWRIRAGERPQPPVRRRREHAAASGDERAPQDFDSPRQSSPEPVPAPGGGGGVAAAGTRGGDAAGEATPIGVASARPEDAPETPRESPRASAPVRRRRPRFPPAPGEPEQLSFDEEPPTEER